jgi:hypothetical protein
MSTTETQTIAAACATATSIALAVGGLAKTWEKFPDKLIPTLCCAVGMVIVPALAGWSIANVIIGFTAGYGATGLNQQFRQITRKSTPKE